MTLLAILVGLALAIGAVNLIMTFGVVARLREHARALSDRPAGPTADASDLILGPGSTPAPFVTTAVDGSVVDGHTLAVERAVVAFFSASCDACEEAIAPLREFVDAPAEGKTTVVAVVTGGEEECRPYVDRLGALATVVREEPDGPMSRAFAVRGFPAFCALADGRITSIGFRPEQLAR